MSSYKIFDLLFSDFMKKFDADSRVFTHKYVVGKQQISKHLLKSDDKLSVNECFDLLNTAQKSFGYYKDWSKFHFSYFDASNNVMVFQFLSTNDKEIQMYKNFCALPISSKQMAFQKEHELANEYYHTKPESFTFTHNVVNIEVFIIMLKLKKGDIILLWMKKRKNSKNSLISLTTHLRDVKNLTLSSKKLRFGLIMSLILLFILKGIIISNFF